MKCSCPHGAVRALLFDSCLFPVCFLFVSVLMQLLLQFPTPHAPRPRQMLDLLCIAAHRDDAELTCGGTLIRAADAGRAVGVLDLTQGEMGTRGSAAIRAAESE